MRYKYARPGWRWRRAGSFFAQKPFFATTLSPTTSKVGVIFMFFHVFAQKKELDDLPVLFTGLRNVFHVCSLNFHWFHVFPNIFKYLHVFSCILMSFHVFSSIFMYCHIFSNYFTWISLIVRWSSGAFMWLCRWSKGWNPNGSCRASCWRLFRNHPKIRLLLPKVRYDY